MRQWRILKLDMSSYASVPETEAHIIIFIYLVLCKTISRPLGHTETY